MQLLPCALDTPHTRRTHAAHTRPAHASALSRMDEQTAQEALKKIEYYEDKIDNAYLKVRKLEKQLEEERDAYDRLDRATTAQLQGMYVKVYGAVQKCMTDIKNITEDIRPDN